MAAALSTYNISAKGQLDFFSNNFKTNMDSVFEVN